MPVTRKGAGGANASARVRFSGLCDDNERKRRDKREHKDINTASTSRDAKTIRGRQRKRRYTRKA